MAQNRFPKRIIYRSRLKLANTAHLSKKPENQSMSNTNTPSSPSEGERIAKRMARVGLCSRREAESWIEAGRVSVNGQKLTSPAVNVTDSDKIEVDGVAMAEPEPTRAWLYHKPRGLVTSHSDPEGRDTVFDNLGEDLPRVISVGRLDINTEGLLLLTNDGGLARMLELPATGWLRRYRVRAHGRVTEADLKSLESGITIDDVSYGPIDAKIDRKQGDNVWLTLGLREGKNREVKKVLGAFNLHVNRLIRISFGPFMLGDLKEGEAREIKSRILRDQLGEKLIAEADVRFPDAREERLAKQAEVIKTRASAKAKPQPVSNRKPDVGRGFSAKNEGRSKPREGGDDRPSFEGKPRSARPNAAPGSFDKRRPAYGSDRPRDDRPRDDRPRDDRPQRDKPFGAKPRGDKPFGDRPRFDKSSQDARPQGRPERPKPYAGKAFGDRSRDDRPRDDRPRDDRPREDRPRGDKPFGAKPFGAKPFGDRPRFDKTRSDRPRPENKGDFKPRFAKDFEESPETVARKTPDNPRGGELKPWDAKRGTDKPRSDRPKSDRPRSDKSTDSKPWAKSGGKPSGAKPYGGKPAGARPSGSRTGGRPPSGRPPARGK